MSRWVILLETFAPLMAAACVEFSPFETDLADDERDRTAENLRSLSERPAPSGPWKLAAISDSHSGYEELAEIVDIVNARGDVSLVLHAGDVTDYGLRQEYRWSLEELSRLRMPWLTVIGNHDTLSNGVEIYESMFGPLDYSFAWGGVRFVCFNSNRLDFGDHVPDWQWVGEQAVAPANGGVVLLTHAPPWVPELRAEDEFAPIANRPGVLLSLHGHLHGPSARAVGAAPSVVIGSAAEGHWVLVTVDGARATIERCRGTSCEPLELSP